MLARLVRTLALFNKAMMELGCIPLALTSEPSWLNYQQVIVLCRVVRRELQSRTLRRISNKRRRNHSSSTVTIPKTMHECHSLDRLSICSLVLLRFQL